MKKINSQLFEDFMLWLLSFIGVFYFMDSIINLNVPGIMISYWAFFAILLTDRLFFKNIVNLFFWKAIFIIGIVLLIVKDVVSALLLLEIYQKNIYGIWDGVLMFLFLNIITLLFIYRSYKFILKKI